jgi:hypothetical protein
LFFPAAGFRRGNSLEDAGEDVHIWARTLNTQSPEYAWSIEMWDWEEYYGNRDEGYTVRAVRVSQN